MDDHAVHSRAWQSKDAQDQVRQALRFAERQLGLAEDFLSQLNRQDVFELFGERIGLTTVLGSLVFDSANHITSLAVHRNINIGYMLARGLTEQTINYVYLLICSEEEFQSWASYSRQKAFKLAKRAEVAGGLAVEIYKARGTCRRRRRVAVVRAPGMAMRQEESLSRSRPFREMSRGPQPRPRADPASRRT